MLLFLSYSKCCVLAVTMASGHSCCDLELHLLAEAPYGFSGHSVAKTPRKPITRNNLRPCNPKGYVRRPGS